MPGFALAFVRLDAHPSIVKRLGKIGCLAAAMCGVCSPIFPE
jgi:hypothetical protein